LGAAFFLGLKRVLEECLASEKRTSAAKAAFKTVDYGTAEAVPLSKTDFFRSL
jgi:hypothetical protein